MPRTQKPTRWAAAWSRDPDRRLTLSGERDGLGMPRAVSTSPLSDADFLLYRKTLQELGRQLLASKLGMLKLNYRDHDGWIRGMTRDRQPLGGQETIICFTPPASAPIPKTRVVAPI